MAFGLSVGDRVATLVSLWNYLRRGVPATWATGEEASGPPGTPGTTVPTP